MHEIVCPNCKKAFSLDEAEYASIMQQVRDEVFEQELHEQLERSAHERETAVELAKAQKDKELSELKAQLKAAADAAEASRKVAVLEKENEIEKLKSDLERQATETKLAVAEAIKPLEKERDKVASDLKIREAEAKSAEANLKDKYETQIKDRDEQINRLKDLKAKLSTKMLGETLEQHCRIAFDSIRPTAFPHAYFEKDTNAKSGSQGDFIFRDFSAGDVEYISIMFEMKNEADTTATKKKNEDFLKELDKDRNEKNCEYAVLVSLLEEDSELYNQGIVDVAHRYPKMFVVRPQFFIQIISLLRNAAQNSLKYREELALVKAQNIDVSNFEDDLEAFKLGFSKNYDIAVRKFDTAIEEIDKAIANLEKVKANLQGSAKQLGHANDKAQDVTVKKLIRNNPTMKAKFDAVGPVKKTRARESAEEE